MGAALGLAAYLLLAPPVFVLAPLATLLALSGPSTVREWWWIAGSTLWLAFTTVFRGGLVDETTLAGGILITGAFFVMMVRRPRPFLPAALLALMIGGAGLIFWGAWFGLGWRDVELAVLRQGWAVIRSVLHPDPDAGSLGTAAALQPYARMLSEGIGPMAGLFPGLMALTALGGLALAWSWYHRISERPLGAPLGRLAEFRFNDQLVWGVVAGLAALVLPAPAPLHNFGGNLMLFFGGLFAVRGMAVVRTWLRQAPGPLLGFMALSLLFILPVAAGGLLSLGLADTWLDFRRRFVSPPAEG